MSKKHAPAARTRTPALAPPPHVLTALCAYIDNGGEHAHLIAIADRILAAAPASFEGCADVPNVFDSVVANVRARMGADHGETVKALDQMLNDEPGVEGAHAYSVLVEAVTDATVVGAALMYRILKDGAR